ncbi:serine/threonine protein kinase [Candidatus Symbiothrix dinenymphae]|nr:serine/threonine protein kinase [Candidatus Symbiothrix dinenymphae]
MAAIERCDFKRGDTIDKYQIESVLGEGSFGKVFRVKDSSQHVYALKILKLWEVPSDIRQKLIERFDMEFETGRIPSNYLVQSIAHGYTNKDIPFIVMEYCPNGDLMQHKARQRLPDWVRVANEVLYGLKDLHRYGKVHRDLKPENVLLKANGTAALTDFGISGDRNKRLTERNLWGKPAQIFGTYAYMPPEQLTGSRDATVLPTTDIFSFGVMMHLLLTDNLPFGKLESEDDLVRYIKNAREGSWNQSTLEYHPLGKGFKTLVTGCLVPDFKKRLQTIDEVLQLMPAGSSSYHSAGGDEVAPSVGTSGMLLRVMQGEEYRKVYQLNDLLQGERRIVTMGRCDGVTKNTVQIVENQSSYVSRRHCTLELDAATRKWYIRDGQWDREATAGWKCSLNGTFVNSSEVTKAGMPIVAGDIISIGDVKLRVEGY